MPKILTPPVRGYRRQCPKCEWGVMRPDDLDGRREADRLYALHVADHAPDRVPTEPEVAEIRRIVYNFRAGILDGKSSAFMCIAVCLPLQGFLSFLGHATEVVKGVVNSSDCEFFHTWLKWDDLIIDPTADQLHVVGRKMPPVYIGPKPDWYEVVP